ncbi:Glycosyltransferase, partial [hydrothermal vent metagenome]
SKMFITKVGYFILNKVTSIKLPREAGDFKLLSRRVVEKLKGMKEKRPFLRGMVCWVGYDQAFISYHREARFAGEAKFSLFDWRVWSNFFDSALISFSSAPLKLSVFLGFFAILVDFGLILHVFIEKFLGRAIPGWAALMIAVLFIGSIQLFCIGIIGLYLNSIFEEVKGRPNYIIESTYGFSKKEK